MYRKLQFVQIHIQFTFKSQSSKTPPSRSLILTDVNAIAQPIQNWNILIIHSFHSDNFPFNNQLHSWLDVIKGQSNIENFPIVSTKKFHYNYKSNNILYIAKNVIL